MRGRIFAGSMASRLIVLTVLGLSAAAWTHAEAAPSQARSIDGTYELTKRIKPNGTVLRPPSVVALYSLDRGRFSLNLFFKNPDGTLASESTIGRYSFSRRKYCEWIIYTTRNNLDHPGVTNAAPALADHCAPVTMKNGQFEFSPPGEGVAMSIGAAGFAAKIDDGGVDYWTKIR